MDLAVLVQPLQQVVVLALAALGDWVDFKLDLEALAQQAVASASMQGHPQVGGVSECGACWGTVGVPGAATAMLSSGDGNGSDIWYSASVDGCKQHVAHG